MNSSVPPRLSVIIAARNEAAWLPACLRALLGQDTDLGVEVIVAANACTDDTVRVARGFANRFRARGWALTVLDLPDGGKPGALDAGDAVARAACRAYLDADVICGASLLGRVLAALETPAPRYATGRLRVAPARSAVTRAYARVWTRLPFVQSGADGAGFFAVNGPGRARWDGWPRLISDDTFARVHFRPDERVEVDAIYDWPMVEGFANLVRVRRRQDAGVAEIRHLYPDLIGNEAKAGLSGGRLLRLIGTEPVGAAVYLAVHLVVRTRRGGTSWSRGR